MLPVLSKNHGSVNRRVLKRDFGKNTIRELIYLVSKETWQEVFTETEVDANFKVYMNLVLHYFAIVFPLGFRY
jgi:hypothetical protein